MSAFSINAPIAVPDRVRVVMAMLKHCADAGELCPTNLEIADRIGAASESRGSDAIALLEAMGLITVVRYRTRRVITITETGRSTKQVGGEPINCKRRQFDLGPKGEVETKECVGCGTVFMRPVNNLRITDGRWDNRRYCEKRCAIRANMAPAVVAGRRFVSFADAAAHSSGLLVDALIRYGWRHDGLPGLTAPEFHALAQDRGVKAA